MLKDSMVVLKGVRYNNIYLLKGNTITGQLITSVGSNDDSSWLKHMILDTQVRRICKLLQSKDC